MHLPGQSGRRLAAAYAATSYDVLVDGRRVGARLGRRSAAIDALLARLGAASGTFVTAWNPRSRPTSHAANLHAHRRMAARLDAAGLRRLPHEGRSLDGRWRERGFLVLDLADRDALALAEAFGQNAVVRLARGGPATLLQAGLLPTPLMGARRPRASLAGGAGSARCSPCVRGPAAPRRRRTSPRPAAAAARNRRRDR